MALPKLEHPTFKVTVPSTKAKLTFRPYTVKEQKVLLMLKESSTPDEVVESLKSLISSCCIEKVNTNKLAYFDIEYIFLKIRAASVGEVATVSYKCNNIVEGEKCGTVTNLNIDLNQIEVDQSGVKSREISVTKDITLTMNYPNLESAKLILDYRTTGNIDQLISAIVNDIKDVTEQDKLYEDFNTEELQEFVNSMSVDTFDKILDFYISCPTVKKEVEFTCNKCKYTEKLTLSGIQDFFA